MLTETEIYEARAGVWTKQDVAERFGRSREPIQYYSLMKREAWSYRIYAFAKALLLETTDPELRNLAQGLITDWVTPATNTERVQMFVGPAHDDPDDIVQSPERQVLGNEDAPPARRETMPFATVQAISSRTARPGRRDAGRGR